MLNPFSHLLIFSSLSSGSSSLRAMTFVNRYLLYFVTFSLTGKPQKMRQASRTHGACIKILKGSFSSAIAQACDCHAKVSYRYSFADVNID